LSQFFIDSEGVKQFGSLFSEPALAAPNIREEDIRESSENTIYCEEVEKFIQASVALQPV
jgi:hypothetical protein